MEAANTDAYLLNLVPFGSNIKSPEEMWTDKKSVVKPWCMYRKS